MAFRRISDSDTFHTYRMAYSTKVDWENILQEEVYEWLDLFSKSSNTSLNLMMPALLSLTAAICGPKTCVQGQGSAFRTSLNTFLIAICDPGGGKTATFEKVVEPVIDEIERKFGKKIRIDNYTNPGIQNHQISNDGYGIITTDEGHRFLSSVNNKQMKGESERSVICKMWNGKGDCTKLLNGSRGFKNTSMSICLYIQPQPLLCEMYNLTGNDGFLDRFLFLASRPVLYSTATVKTNFNALLNRNLQNFVNVFNKMFGDHINGVAYSFTDSAQIEYDKMVDSYADYLNEKYMDCEDENSADKENIPTTQTDFHMTSSKDTIHVVRIAAILHILTHYIIRALEYREGDILPVVIDINMLNSARMLYSVLAQHKSVMVQNSRLPLKQLCMIVYFFGLDMQIYECEKLIHDVAHTSLVEWFSILRGIFSKRLIAMPWKLSGDISGNVIEIDESLFGKKRKYNRGSGNQNIWVFGAVEKSTRNAFMQIVQKRDRETLLPIIKSYVEQGSTIYSDQWGAYFTLNAEGYVHQTVNHSKEF